jgi:hypothetical protein
MSPDLRGVRPLPDANVHCHLRVPGDRNCFLLSDGVRQESPQVCYNLNHYDNNCNSPADGATGRSARQE